MLSMYLGSAEKLVGIHPVSMAAAKNGILGKIYPEILTANTDWMQGDALNIEELIKLQPDVVFYSGGATAEAEALRDAGIPGIGVHATKWQFDCIETFDRWVNLLDQVFPGEDRVAGVNEYAQRTLDEIQGRVADIPDDERVRAMFLFQYDDTVMITSGKNFFGQYWIDCAGGINVAEELSEVGSNATINMEQVYAWNPDVIYITNFTPTQPADLYNNAIRGDDWSGVAAAQNKKVYKMPLGAYRSYTPGVDTPMTLLFMAKSLYPEIFADIDLTEEVKNYYSDFFGITLSDEDVQSMYNPSADAGVAGFMNK
jgi:iron complex transport system substrate-binding protein